MPIRPSALQRAVIRRTTGLVAAIAIVATSMAGPVASAPAPGRDAGSAAAAPAGVAITFTRVATGLTKPLFLTHEGNSSGRRFIVEQDGRIKILLAGGRLYSPSFLNIAGLVYSGGFEQGLLGLAFHPDYSETSAWGYRRFYVYYTNNSQQQVVAEFLRSASSVYSAISSPNRILMTMSDPFENHNGGMLAFGKDGYLYIATGDGGSADDPFNNAENLNSPLGKILRIDVRPTDSTGTAQYDIPPGNPYLGRSGLDQIWQSGLRNPFRFSFDRTEGDLFIGDVGQNIREEVDRIQANASGLNPGPGIKWGWDTLEGSLCHEPASGCSRVGTRLPLAEYSHSVSGTDNCSVTGGYVYRGAAHPTLRGRYLFGDWCSGRVWSVIASQPQPQNEVLLRDTGYRITSFGEDKAGELYLVDGNGSVYRIGT
jgi:glucose/arabinose dehydrogenase